MPAPRTDPLERDLLAPIRAAADKARAHGTPMGPSLFGVIECYDVDNTLHFEQRPNAPTVCPLGAAVLWAPHLESDGNSKRWLRLTRIDGMSDSPSARGRPGSRLL